MFNNIINNSIQKSLNYWNSSKINNFILKHPFLSSVLFGGFKNASIDIFIQSLTNNKHKSINWKRVSVFAIFGFSYTGGGQYILFNKIFPKILPGGIQYGKVKKGLIGAIILDNFVHMPFIYMPTFYCMQQYPYSNDIKNAITNGLNNHKKCFLEDLTMQASIFIPFQAFNLSLNPPHLRVPTLCIGSMLWISTLSLYRGGQKEK